MASLDTGHRLFRHEDEQHHSDNYFLGLSVSFTVVLGCFFA